MTQNQRLAVYILYTNAASVNGHVLGQSFRHNSIVIYGRTIKQYEHVFSFPSQTTIETMLLLHEWGHLFGFVNKGSSMMDDHADTRHEAHCQNPECIMFWHMSVQPNFGPLHSRVMPTFR